MRLEEMVLRDGRKLTDVWLYAGNEVRESDFAAFVSIPEVKSGKVFVEHGNGSTHMVSLYVFHTNGESDFANGVGVSEEPVTSGVIRDPDGRQRRREMLAVLLEEMDRDPISPAGELAGEKLWKRIQSASIQAPLMSNAAEDATRKLEEAGFVVGSHRQGLLVSVKRNVQPYVRVWLDVGNTVRVVGDKSDPDNELLLDVLGALDGPEARERARIAWSEPSH